MRMDHLHGQEQVSSSTWLGGRSQMSNFFLSMWTAEHVLLAAVQTRPVVSVQSSLPQAQADGLGAEPSVVAQTGPARHLFWDA